MAKERKRLRRKRPIDPVLKEIGRDPIGAGYRFVVLKGGAVGLVRKAHTRT